MSFTYVNYIYLVGLVTKIHKPGRIVITVIIHFLHDNKMPDQLLASKVAVVGAPSVNQLSAASLETAFSGLALIQRTDVVSLCPHPYNPSPKPDRYPLACPDL